MSPQIITKYIMPMSEINYEIYDIICRDLLWELLMELFH